jgi:putative membrane protein insertion efficiency factor
MKKILISLVKFYQMCLSPFFVSRCRYTPTCSMYTIECLEKYGILKGFWLGIKRISKCRPGSQGGFDPIP